MAASSVQKRPSADSPDKPLTSCASKKLKLEADVQVDLDAEVQGAKKRKPGRRRKKQIYMDLTKQMEFYFSDANIAKSKFMTEILQQDQWVDMDVFLKFNKVSRLLADFFGQARVDDLHKALTKTSSDLIEVRQSGEQYQVRRKTPVQLRAKVEEEACTLYVENLPSSTSIEVLQEAFSKFGNVLYVSLPKFKHNNAIKGFAFIEFDTADAVANVLQTHEATNQRLQTSIDPAKLQSIQAYQHEQAVISEKQEAQAASNAEACKAKKKRRVKKKCRDIPDTEMPTKSVDSGCPEASNLRVMSKLEWKRLRNKYLDLQKKSMSQIKSRIRKFALDNQHRANVTPSCGTEPDGEHDGATVPEAQEAPTDVSAAVRVSDIPFEPNIIVRFVVEEPLSNVNAWKQKIKAAVIEPVKYVDIENGATEYFVRCADAVQADTLSKVKVLGQGCVLAADDEKTYWNKLQQQRSEKLSGLVVRSTTRPRPRGKVRLIKQFKHMEERMQQMNSHKYFDIEDD